MEQRNFKKLFEFHSFSEIFYCEITRHRNTNLDVFIQCQHTRTILRNENMGQSLFKKYSKSQKFNEILCCGMTRFRNVELDVFRQYQNTFGTESFSETFKIPKIHFCFDFSDGCWEESFAERNNKNTKIFQFNPSRFIKFFLYNIHSGWNKTFTN